MYIYTYMYIYIRIYIYIPIYIKDVDCRRALEPFPTTRLAAGGSTLETTQGRIGGFFSQLPFKCFLPEVASVGNRFTICPWTASRVDPHGVHACSGWCG